VDEPQNFECAGSSIPGPHISQLYRVLAANDLRALQPLFHAFFATILHDGCRNTPIAQYEGYYASILDSHFAALDLDIRLEDATNQGRIESFLLPSHQGQTVTHCAWPQTP
jgi:hypothetical protein